MLGGILLPGLGDRFLRRAVMIVADVSCWWPGWRQWASTGVGLLSTAALTAQGIGALLACALADLAGASTAVAIAGTAGVLTGIPIARAWSQSGTPLT